MEIERSETLEDVRKSMRWLVAVAIGSLAGICLTVFLIFYLYGDSILKLMENW